MVREAGLEPARPEWTLEPESSESANSTTRASLALFAARKLYYHLSPHLSTPFFDLFAFSGAEWKIPVDKSVTARYNNLAVFRDDNMRMCWNW